MKFTGLILMCASSCLALLLPALGIVKFPRVRTGMNQVSSGSVFPSDPSSILQGSQVAVAPANSNWLPANAVSGSNAVLPPGQLVSNSFPAPAGGGPSGVISPFGQSSPIDVPNAAVSEPAGTGSVTRFGMGIWLLLGPVCLIGLALWTFSPNPSGSGRKS